MRPGQLHLTNIETHSVIAMLQSVSVERGGNHFCVEADRKIKDLTQFEDL
jgi:hypothetical protein